MLYEVIISENPINLHPESEIEEILQNCRMILSTPRYTVPYAREFAMRGDRLDNPIPRNIALMKADIITAFKESESRVTVRSVEFKGDALTGKLQPIVRVFINE